MFNMETWRHLKILYITLNFYIIFLNYTTGNVIIRVFIPFKSFDVVRKMIIQLVEN